MDAAPVLKRKGAAEAAPEPWVHVPATKIRRLDAEVPPVDAGVGVPLAGSGAGVPPPFGVGEARVVGNVAAAATAAAAVDAAPLLKRKGPEAPQPWLDVDGFIAPATKIRRLDAEVPPVDAGVGVPLAGSGAGVPPPFGVGEARVVGNVAAATAAAAVDAAPLLKRKGPEAPQPWLDVDGFIAPATKIRRLDAEVPPVDPGVGAPLVQPGASVPPPRPFVVEEVGMSGDVAPPVAVAAVGAPAVNDERAIVVYQPAEAARNLLQGPLWPGVSLRVSPDWIHGLKSTMLQDASNHRALFEELPARDENLHLAMVPWAPAQVHAHTCAGSSAATAAAADMMEADQDGDGASMDVEQDAEGQPMPAAGGALLGEAFHHQQRPPPQHCVAPQQLQLPAASYLPAEPGQAMFPEHWERGTGTRNTIL